MLDLFEATIAVFEPYLGQNFALLGATEAMGTQPIETEAMALTLVEAKLLPSRKRPNSANLPSRDAFSLVWHGPKSVFLAQGCYTLMHPDPAVGLIEGLFLTAIGDDETGYRYQSIFN